MTKHSVLVSNYVSSGGSVYFETRRKFARSEVHALGNIEGVDWYDVNGYTVSFRYGRAFSWDEIAPQAVLVLADAFGVQVDDLNLKASPKHHEKRNESMSWIVEAAKKLREPKEASCTPLYPFALTADDVKPGVAFLRYNTRLGLRGEDVFIGTPFNSTGIYGERTQLVRTQNESISGIFLADAGIAKYARDGWNGDNFSVANTPEGRRQFVQWLLTRGGSAATQAATKLVEKYPSDYVTTRATVEGGIVTVRIEHII
jgi:hypothetical protein